MENMLELMRVLRSVPISGREAAYLSSLAVVRGALARAIAGKHGNPLVECDPALRDPDFMMPVLHLVETLGTSYFRWEVRGIECVPDRGAALMVGNHNGGIINMDSLLTLVAVWKRFGAERALHPLAHDLVFFDPVLGRVASRMGVLRAGHDSAARAFARGNMVLVYPGSDLDTWRPFKDRNKIELAGRKGFVRLALRQGVPIVPVVSAGTQEQFVVLWRGDELARRSGIKRHLRAEAFPIVLALPWGLTSGYLPYVPLPAQTTLRFGAPIGWPDLGPEAADDPAAVTRCYEQVRSEMQLLLDSICEGRRWLRGQPQSLRHQR